jgi:hypothetical protein
MSHTETDQGTDQRRTRGPGRRPEQTRPLSDSGETPSGHQDDAVLPSGQPHFHWAKSGEYITQVSAIGPLGLAYIDPANDPRSRGATTNQ